MPFCAESSKMKFNCDVTTNGSPGNLPLCFDHHTTTTSSNPNSMSSAGGQKSVIGIGLGGSLFEDDLQYSTPAIGKRKGSLGGSDTATSEHLYDMPLIKSPIDSPVLLETLHLLSPASIPHNAPSSSSSSKLASPKSNYESPISSLEKSIASSSFSSGTSNSSSFGKIFFAIVL